VTGLRGGGLSWARPEAGGPGGPDGRLMQWVATRTAQTRTRVCGADARDALVLCTRQVGRADKMGLAISLAGTCKERVWCVPAWGGGHSTRGARWSISALAPARGEREWGRSWGAGEGRE
jgi:hypothetical protein